MYLSEPGLMHPGHHHHQLALAAAAAQHFQAAGLLANHPAFLSAGNNGSAPNGHPGQQPTGHPLPPRHPSHGNAPSETYQLYPWLLTRHGRFFQHAHRFPGGECEFHLYV
jgi:hypothetical protein